MNRGTLIVIAKEPVPGRVKTRLQTEFTAHEAAALARASLVDTLNTVRSARASRRATGAAGRGRPDRGTAHTRRTMLHQ